MQRRAVCFFCSTEIDHDPIFAAPCDHEDCSSAVFHGICLMDWRERREEAVKMFARWFEEHGGRRDRTE